MNTPCVEHDQKGDANGYGRTKYNGRNYGAHVVALIKATGELPNGRVAMHACDNPRCINEDHLSWGTYSQNNLDSIAKGRMRPNPPAPRYGFAHHAAKIDRETADLIKSLYVRRSKEFGTVALARRFGIAQSQAHLAITGKHWSQL